MSSSSASTDPFNDTNKVGSLSLGIFIACLAFALPLGLMYSMFFYKKTSWYRLPLLFASILGLGYIACLMFYRMAITGDKQSKIDKMSGADALFVFYNTLAGFIVVFVTMVALKTNPALVTIFENTHGYLFIHMWGVTDLCSNIFVSEYLSDRYSNIDPREFNYNFLITRMNIQNVEEFIDSAKTCVNKDIGTTNLPLDFKMNIPSTDLVDKLRNLVNLKYSFGHFVWIYLSSIVALIISMTGCIMYS